MEKVAGRAGSETHTVSAVIPVYGGERTLASVVAEIAVFSSETTSKLGHRFRVAEVILVFDHGRDDSARVIRELEERYDFVRPVWLSRNYGQHAATLAGMASSGSDWIVTLDEDGQHDPAYIGEMLDTAMETQSALVYARPVNRPSHGALRNLASRMTKSLAAFLTANPDVRTHQSYRLMLGSIGRSVAAYSGSGVYLDVALSWVAPAPATTPIHLRDEGDRKSGYSLRTLVSHFWRLVLTSGTRGLRAVSVLGAAFAVAGAGVAIAILVAHARGSDYPRGWASLVIVVLLSSGAILFSLGMVAEYLGVSVNQSLGKPPYLIQTDPSIGPLGRKPTVRK